MVAVRKQKETTFGEASLMETEDNKEERNMTLEQWKQRRPSHPGIALLAPLMEKHNINSSAELADRVELPARVVENILKGKEKIDYEVATRLSSVFGKAADIMWRMQEIVDFYDAHERRPDRDEHRWTPEVLQGRASSERLRSHPANSEQGEERPNPK